ncbi:MAG: NAD(P)-dependent oxidoreductase [Proteobacteria bacterium]|nr:NAD(P)-dependent oxidoreductase [Pseudomonadota bacterium]
MTDKPKVAWIGLGKMGEHMAGHLLSAGFPVTVYNRTVEKAAPLVEKGATAADSIAAAADGADVIISMISDDNALRAVASTTDGVLSAAAPGSIYIDMSTVSPEASAEIASNADKAGVAYLRAPVNGTVVQAESGALIILVSGPRATFDTCTPVFEAMGSKLFYFGDAEQARSMKLAINMMVGITASMFSEAVVFAKAAGLDWDQAIDVIGQSAVGSPYTNFRGPALKAMDFTPTFSTKQIAKDFDLALATAETTGAPMPLTSLVRQFWSDMIDTGKGDLDFLSYAQHLDEQRSK